jgi:hypothetical protein
MTRVKEVCSGTFANGIFCQTSGNATIYNQKVQALKKIGMNICVFMPI